jgi:hypothetical protein
MTPRTDPTAEASAKLNGAPPVPDDFDDFDGIDPGPREPGKEVFLDLDPASCELLADMAWTIDEGNAGRWAEYAGDYIAVYHKRLLGNGPRPVELRERVAKQFAVPPDKVAISYVEPPIEY